MSNYYTRPSMRPKIRANHSEFSHSEVGKQVEVSPVVRLGTFAFAVAVLSGMTVLRADQDPSQTIRPTYRGGVSMVAVSAVVRKHNGQWVSGLKQSEFEVLDNGAPRPIQAFESQSAGINIALLVDLSGSMDIAAKLTPVRQTIDAMVTSLSSTSDNVGLYAFDTRLHEIQAMQPASPAVLEKLKTLRPFGATSIYDAIAETSRTLALRGPRRAIVVLTDGGDNASRLTPEAVSGMASAIDVPVYVVLVVSPLDQSGSGVMDEAALDAQLHGRLADLAHWTGGEIFPAVGATQAAAAAHQIVTDLRQQYWLAFEPGVQPGWHTLEVRTHNKDFVVRARSGYLVPSRSGTTPSS